MPKPNADQQRFNATLPGANTKGLRRAHQIASQRRFPYDGSLAPTCLRCGAVRENRRGLHCDLCSQG